ncbi:MAG TPA: RNA polymerase sigma factor [Opitutaceae bacterium]|nr:RNA polymerase sigma factor [Opitutaceae bacterium]
MDESSTTTLGDRVRRAQRGDEMALRELIVSYQHRVAGFTYAITGRSDSVEDLVQMVFVKMARSIARLKAPEQFEPWLFRLARNTCIDHLRRQKLRRIFIPFAPEHENVPEPPGAVDAEELDALRHALAQLRPRDRALLALVQEGRSHAEIAQTFGTSVAAVKARLHRAREQLRIHYHSDEI